MKKRIILLLSILLCMCSVSALAAQMHMAEKERILPGLPPGMVATYTFSDGRVDILIDTYQTDWDMVASAARKSGSLTIHPGIIKPADMQRAKAQSDYFRQSGQTAAQSDQEMAELLAKWGNGRNGDYACSTQGWAIGRYDEGTGLFIPEEIPAELNACFGVRWIDESDVSYTERVMITVRYTQKPPIYTRRQDVDRKDVVANAALNENRFPAGNVTSVTVEDGSVVYRLKGVPVNEDGRELYIYTAVGAPSWLKADESWGAYLLNEGKETELAIVPGASYGLKNHCVVIPRRIEDDSLIYKNDWAIKWVDPYGTVQAVFYLEAEFHVDDPKLTVSYDSDAEPMPRKNIEWTTANPLDGLGVSYDEGTGLFRLTIDEDRLPANGKTDLTQTTVSIGVSAPADAVRCVVYMIRGDVIYGNTGEKQMRLGELNVEPGQLVYALEFIDCIYFREVSATLKNGKKMSYYVAPMMVGQYGGTTIIYEWLDAQNQRIGMKQHLTLAVDSYELVERVSPSLTKNPNKLVEEPTVVTQEGGLYVAVAELPQMSDDALRSEITLLDGDGNKAQPEEPVLVYLPYPDGKTMEECLYDTFVVYHQLDDGVYEEYSVENGKLTLTSQGLCMEVDSFSPYFLNWEEGTAPDVSELPETGDKTNLAGYMLMLCAACLAALMMKKNAHDYRR